jgi:ankyrin repeat protein
MTEKSTINMSLDYYYDNPTKIILDENLLNNDLISNIDFDIIKLINSLNPNTQNNNIKKFNKKNFNPLLFRLIANNQKDKLSYVLKNNEENLDINIQDKDGDTPLHISVFLCNLDIIKILINHGANINIKDKWGQTAIHRLYFCMNDIQIIKIIEIFRINKANFNQKDNFGNTILHLALKQIIKLEIKLNDNHYKFINKLKSLISIDIKNNENISIKDLLEMINYI